MTAYYYAALFVSFFLIFQILRLRSEVFFRLAQNSVALLDKLLAQTDEEAKIKLIEKSNKLLVRSIAEVSLLFIIALALGSTPIVVYILITNTAFQSLEFLSLFPVLSISAGSTLPFLIPSGKKDTSGYSDLSKLLHRMALNNYHLSEKLFRKEKKRLKKKKISTRDDFVIITGLARAGTTSLMNDLSDVDDFVSLSYANMPFLTAPNLWAKIYKPQKENLKERSHKDGIKIGYNSNEALEEYFFKVKANDAFIKAETLCEYELTKEDYNDYLDYQAVVKQDNKKIYLAKNNNFILRYKSVRTFNDDFLLVVLFRDPLRHAASLKEKHLDYKKLQTEDPFVLEYMNWLGHHEFGIDQKPFMFRSSSLITAKRKNELDYWLEIWISYYSYILELEHPNTLFVNYDDYCNYPNKIINRVLNETNISATLTKRKGFINNRKITTDYSVSIYNKALTIYNQLKKISVLPEA